MRATKTVNEFRSILAVEAKLAEAQAACEAIGLKSEVKRIKALRASVMSRLETIQDRAYALIGGAAVTRQ